MNHIYQDHDAWKAAQTGPIHQIFTNLEWVTIHTVVCDLMHVKHLGTDMNLAGAVLWLMCFEILPGALGVVCMMPS
jgi:mannose/fructose/N-acetylgalactosamine-specific phosphotransferase system component IID